MTRQRLPRSLPLALTALLLLGACGTTTTDGRTSSEPNPAPTTEAPREVSALAPRALVAHQGGLVLIDTESGELLDEIADDTFVRLSEAGDGRHVAVADSTGFQLYDTGVWSEGHGDHSHRYVSTPGLTDVVRSAEKAGHVVVNAGHTTFFADGTGEITTVPTAEVADPDATAEVQRTEAPHHGVALQLSDDTLLTTQGTAEERRTVQVRDGDDLVTETNACPGVHGETTAAPTDDGDVVVLGCENGPVILRDGTFHKVPVDEAYARTGNLAGHPDSAVVLSDWKTDPDAELERPTEIALIDTRTDSLRTVDLGSAYWFRSLARGPHGEAVVLTYDGSLRVLDEESGREVSRIDAIKPWKENKDWQQPGPVLRVVGHLAYVTDASTDELVVVDLAKGRVVDRWKLPGAAVELVVTTGIPAEEHGHEH
ncbi:hypothetical protein [Nocardioides gilvus]|uniref:hypothetical protein n=1 Tax=Nocardioides gilvus TaxID=1735589 RepID=UPI00194ECEB9|nr:hypothetical protein [Nocardioides gilvus]